MSSKACLKLNTNHVVKKKFRNVISLETKLEVLRRFDEGHRAVDIARDMDMPPTTIRTIRHNTQSILNLAQTSEPNTSDNLTKARTMVMEKMEKQLVQWLKDQQVVTLLIFLYYQGLILLLYKYYS